MNIHIGLNTSHLSEAVDFYTKLFHEPPVKQKNDYAKFLPTAVPVNFTLNVQPDVRGNQVEHFGVQLEDADALDYHKQRLQQEGFFAREETDTMCCYALQDKFWVTDPDGNEWEFFYTKADIEAASNMNGGS
jgi:lactoylglutathione lyase